LVTPGRAALSAYGKYKWGTGIYRFDARCTGIIQIPNFAPKNPLFKTVLNRRERASFK
jgi:hypothetical protein